MANNLKRIKQRKPFWRAKKPIRDMFKKFRAGKMTYKESLDEFSFLNNLRCRREYK